MECGEFRLLGRLDWPSCGGAAPPPFKSLPSNDDSLRDYPKRFYCGEVDTSPQCQTHSIRIEQAFQYLDGDAQRLRVLVHGPGTGLTRLLAGSAEMAITRW